MGRNVEDAAGLCRRLIHYHQTQAHTSHDPPRPCISLWLTRTKSIVIRYHYHALLNAPKADNPPRKIAAGDNPTVKNKSAADEVFLRLD